MRKLIPLLILLLILPSQVKAQEDVGDPGKVNKILDNFLTPQLSPGERGEFRFTFSNPHQGTMINIELNASIYMYATIEESRIVNESWQAPYILQSGTIEYKPPISSLSGGVKQNVTFTIVTTSDMPHGSIFSQSAYFLRFWLEFDFVHLNGTTQHYTMASRGYFTKERWENATREPQPGEEPYYRGNINITYLGVDGILPDSSFGVREPIPIWPFYLLIALMALFGFLALVFYAEENPSQFPRLDKKWASFKGRMRQIFWKYKKRGV